MCTLRGCTSVTHLQSQCRHSSSRTTFSRPFAQASRIGVRSQPPCGCTAVGLVVSAASAVAVEAGCCPPSCRSAPPLCPASTAFVAPVVASAGRRATLPVLGVLLSPLLAFAIPFTVRKWNTVLMSAPEQACNKVSSVDGVTTEDCAWTMDLRAEGARAGVELWWQANVDYLLLSAPPR
jgi:hypothetical protein